MHSQNSGAFLFGFAFRNQSIVTRLVKGNRADSIAGHTFCDYVFTVFIL